MRKVFYLVLAISIITTACTSATETLESPIPLQFTSTVVPPASTSTPESVSVISTATDAAAASATPVLSDDFFTQNGITLPAPVCNALTQPQTEGPYYIPNTPEKHSLLEEGMTGTRLILVGYVLDQNCQPLPNAWLDFWQADANGEYDNVGYRLRGHQFTDLQGRYYLETVLPGLYSSRPIEHIHVKVRPEAGAETTSQLYFPDRPIEGLTVTLEDRGDYLVGYFNFVVQK
jgi:protocatechuate 3,4-dioxygenase beta subunit